MTQSKLNNLDSSAKIYFEPIASKLCSKQCFREILVHIIFPPPGTEKHLMHFADRRKTLHSETLIEKLVLVLIQLGPIDKN